MLEVWHLKLTQTGMMTGTRPVGTSDVPKRLSPMIVEQTIHLSMFRFAQSLSKA